MDLTAIAVVAGALLMFSLVSGRLDGTVLTAPMLFVALGFLIGDGGIGIAQIDMGRSALHVVAEFTLILVLFSDAARIDLKHVRKDHDLPLRMLGVGLPLMIVLGTWAATLLFPDFSLWEAALLAALLAPTDAALGQAVVTAQAVPSRIRQAINIESGLNDGIVLPAVLLFAALASAVDDPADSTGFIRFGLMQVTLGPLVGVAVGFAGARLLDEGVERGATSMSFQGIGILALAVLSYVLAELVGGNGFIAAFVSGMTFGNTIRHQCLFLFEFMETEGQLLMLITFMIFGIALLPEGLASIELSHVGYAAISLTVIRMSAIAISLLGSGVRVSTCLFLGWFGPRGLASILFVLLILEEAEMTQQSTILSVTVITVALSVLLHGLTAAPFAAAYGRLAARMEAGAEKKQVIDLPLRHGPMGR